MDQRIKNNNDFLLFASESSKLINETAGKIDTGPGSESENETETKISLLSPNLSVRNEGYEIKFNVKKINEITEIATCDFSKGYLFPIKTHSVTDYVKIDEQESNDEGNDEGNDEVSAEYTVNQINSSGEKESSNEKMYTLHPRDTLNKNTGIYLTDSQKNDILVNNSIAFTHKKKD